ncbi:hypothetical protein Shyd_79710 [Streptomyces hydrogenans]|uniref:Uncharacterized protein n=2 Tax=Streptomyces hydrogenans TaxID=1873719 RepID=A0ABQ3PNI8_9ACTN|nr:hypothetical protein GCM10018784_63570 [Streptomyces hydrogenans]GHI26600.1 hypothetical protein Shyd_79710 [Streptomyces hydrogenans]
MLHVEQYDYFWRNLAQIMTVEFQGCLSLISFGDHVVIAKAEGAGWIGWTTDERADEAGEEAYGSRWPS